MEQYIISYSPVIIVVLTFIFKNKIFVTPEQLLRMKEEIRREIRAEYATKEAADEIKQDIADIKNSVHEINLFLINQSKK